MADNFDEEDPIMRDPTPEEMNQGMQDSTQFVARTFLDESHYQTIHQTLSNKWDRYHSLSAALKLMETYGVKLSEAEEKQLTEMEEAQQINKLVSKMPQQSNDQFQQFFLQLQLLVSTAMRVRRSLEEGRPDDVAGALEDADTTGIAGYILNVAIVQAGSEVKSLKDQFADWTQEADNKMGRLLRGQQDNITAQKQLAIAEGELAKQNGEQSAKSAKVVMNFNRKNDAAMKGILLTGWAQAAKMQKLEATLRIEYADRLQDLEDNLAKVQYGQVSKCENIILKKIQQDAFAAMGICFDSWKKDVEQEGFMKENGDKLKAMEEKLANQQDAAKENATKVLSKMTTGNDAGLKSAAVKGWISVRHMTIRQDEMSKQRVFNESKLDQFAKKKSEEAKYVIKKFCAENNSGLVYTVFNSWMDWWAEMKAENEIAEKLHNAKMKSGNYSKRNKASAGSVMNRAAEHGVTLLLTRCMNSWKLDSKMELTIKTYHAKIDAKRGQLVGVQQMFRNFAQQLEGGIGDSGTNSARTFDNNTRVERKMKKDGNSLSLPDIKQGSARKDGQPSGRKESAGGARKESSSGSRGGKASKQLSNRSRDPIAVEHGEPKNAWG